MTVDIFIANNKRILIDDHEVEDIQNSELFIAINSYESIQNAKMERF